jgi:hypothetical protein
VFVLQIMDAKTPVGDYEIVDEDEDNSDEPCDDAGYDVNSLANSRSGSLFRGS